MTLINQIKSEIDLINFALANNFTLDKQKSSRSCKVFRDGPIRKIAISNQGGKWLYFNYDKEKGGSIIDMVMDMNGITFKEAVQLLKKEISNPTLPTIPSNRPIQASCFIREEAEKELKNLKRVAHQRYLLSRNITLKTICSPRFQGCIYSDQYNNAVFPHYDQEGYTGSEKKNNTFTGFTDHGKKTLWFSKSHEFDNCFLFTESAIDCLSYYQIKDDGKTRYFSLGGNLSPNQIKLIDCVMKKYPKVTKKLGFDNDKDGLKYVTLFIETWPEENFIIDMADSTGDDWTDALKKMVSSNK